MTFRAELVGGPKCGVVFDVEDPPQVFKYPSRTFNSLTGKIDPPLVYRFDGKTKDGKRLRYLLTPPEKASTA